MTERLARLTPDDLDAEQSALYDAIAGGPRATGPQHFALSDDRGALHGPFGLMLHAPGVGVPLQELGAAIRFRTSLSTRLREIAILMVAVATGSEFEWHAHTRVGLAAGLTEDELEALARGRFVPRDEAEAAAVSLCADVLADAPLGDVTYVAAREALGEAGIVELVVLLGYYRTLASMLEVFRVDAPVDDRTDDIPAL